MPPTADLDDALILGLQPVRDADLIITLLDPNRGRVDAYARAARKSARRYGGRLELFLQGQARLRQGRGGLPQLVGFDRVAHLAPSGLNWGLLCVASSVAEMAVTASQPEHADPHLFRWARGALLACEGLPEVRLRLASLAFDLGFLNALGSLPDLTRCGECGGTMAQGGDWPEASDGWRCASCVARARADAPPAPLQLSPTAVDAVYALLADPIAVHTAFLSRRAGRVLRSQVDKLLAEVLPRPLRSRASLREALAGIVG